MQYPVNHLTPFLLRFPRKTICKRIESAKTFARAPAIPLSTFKINTCKSVSKQRTLSTSRMNTYEKPGGRGHQLPPIFSFTPIFEGPLVYPRSSSAHFRRHMRFMHPEWIYGTRHVTPLSPVPSSDCAYFPSPRACALIR